MNIFIVDDEPAFHELLRDIFELNGCKVVGNAYNGEEALLVYRTLALSYEKPDLVIIDLSMSEKDGVETAAKMRDIDRSIKILFVSTDENAGERALEIGAEDFIKKPFEISEFLSALEKIKNLS